MSLAKFIASENVMRGFMGQPEIKITEITPAIAQELFKTLDSNLSPEALTADGERPRAKQIALAKIYNGAIADLKVRGHQPEFEMYNA